MPGPFEAADYAVALANLLPRGRAWPAEAGSTRAQLLGALTPPLARLDARAQALLIDAFPRTAVELLDAWEQTLGLPDPCAGVQPTVALRQAQVVARFQGFGGQSVGFFVTFAALLGFAITIQEFTGAQHDQWQVTVAASGAALFEFGVGRFGDAFETLSANAQVLQCEFARLKPAHTLLIWNFI